MSRLDNLNIELPGLAGAVQHLIEDGTTFSAVQVGPNTPIPPQALAGTDSVAVGSGRFMLGGTATATAQLQISVLRDPGSTRDDDQILQVTPGGVWLKHKLEAQVSGALGGSLGGGVTFGLTGGLEASLMQYRAHQPGDQVREKLIEDIASFRLPLRLNDVQSLQGGDILACTVHGRLGLSAQLTLADTLSAAMAALDKKLGAVGLGVVTLQEGLTVGVNLSIEDHYRLVFRAGSRNGTTRVEVRKTRGRTAGGHVGLSVMAVVAPSQAVQQAVSSYLESRLDQAALSHVAPLLQRIGSGAAFESLSPEERAVAGKIAARLGLTNLPQQWPDLQARLNGIVETLTATLSGAVQQKVEADATLSYTRIQTDETILSCELEGAALARHHSDLLLGNFTGLLDNLAAGTNGYRLIEYLKQTEIRKQISFGLSISIGRWAVYGMDRVDSVWKHQVDLENRERWSFTGQQTYTKTWGGATSFYAFGLGAAMDEFSSAPGASNAGEFKYSLSFGWSWNETLTPALLADALDLANVWGISKPEANGAHQNAILSQASGQVVRIELEIQVSDAGVRSLLAVPADQLEGAWIEAMAPALSRVRVPPETHTVAIDARGQIYREAALFAFEQSADGETEIGAIAGYVRYPNGPANVIDRLKEIDRGQTDIGLNVLWTATTIDTRPAGRCRRVKAALDQLADAINHNRDKDQIQQVFDKVQDLITRPYECRLLGRVVSRLVKASSPQAIITTLKVTKADGTVLLI
jgi:hypothetical protein